MIELENLSDEELITFIQDESNDSFSIDQAKEIIFLRYQHAPMRVIRELRLKYQKYEEIDLVHQGYLSITAAINAFKIERKCPFKVFVFRVIKRGLLNQYYHKDKHRHKELTMTYVCDDHDFSTIDSLSGNPIESSVYNNIMLEEEVDNMKSRLTESEYNCIMARYYGASYKETAKIFGYTVKQVDNKIQSVRKSKARFISQISL